jgi:mannosyltransferase
LANKFPHLKFVIVGQTLNKNEISLITSKRQIVHFKNISEVDLNLLYHFSTCLLYPSLYEGFGIPIVESSYSGGVCLALNNSSIPEVKGPNTILLDKLDVTLFYDALQFILTNRVIKPIGKRKFSWDKTFLQTVDVYKRAIN